MKGLILSGGLGTRLRPLTHSQQKQLIPVANKPVLFYAIEDLIEAGIKDIGIIVGPNKEDVKKTVRSKDWDANIEFIHQPEPKGLSHAIIVAEDFLDGEPFVMYLGDNILREGIVDHAKDFLNSDCESSIMLNKVSNPQAFGIAKTNEDGEIVQLIEKPKNPPTNLAVIGVYFFRPAIFKAVKEIKPSWRNQLEITDAIQWLIDNNYRVKSSLVRGWWKDTGKPEDILHANKLVLDEIKSDIPKNINANITGKVEIPQTSSIDKKSIIKGPVSIGENCVIKNAKIGPYVSIGDNCKIVNSKIENSVIMKNTKIQTPKKIVDSLLGKDVKIHENTSPKTHKLTIGDHSKIHL